MKIDYQKTIEKLKECELIKESDKYAVCLFRPEDNVTTITTSNVDYLMTANNDEIKLFDLHKKTGEYLNNFQIFKKTDITFSKKLKERKYIWASKGIFGGVNIAIRFIPEKFAHDFVIPKKVCGFEQLNERLELFTFIKETYNSLYENLKKNYVKN